jgi:glycosyltransferase involved in cell wall biosynthesis
VSASERRESLDIVCTVYNDEKTLREVVGHIAAAIDPLGLDWRLILVCDGSPDKSWEVMRGIAEERSNVLALELSRNFGQHIAVTAGLDHADADYVVAMDSDLQDPPTAIGAMLEKLKTEDLDIVIARRLSRQDPLAKRFTSWVFWRMIRALAGTAIVDNQLMLRVMTRRYVAAFRSLREHHRLIAGLMAWLGFRGGVMEMPGGKRLAGRSNYNVRRLFRLAMDATTSLSLVPLRFATGLGLAVMASSMLYGLYVLVRTLLGHEFLAGFPTLVVLITFLSGAQLLILGIIGEYLGRTLREGQGRPLYFVRTALGAGAEKHVERLPLPPLN